MLTECMYLRYMVIVSGKEEAAGAVKPEAEVIDREFISGVDG